MRPTSPTSRIALVLACLLAACGDPTGSNQDPVPTRVVLSQASLTLDDEGSTSLSAQVVDQSGNTMTSLPAELAVSWVVRDPSIASVTGGVVQALRPGQTYVVATAGTLRDSASLTVRPIASRLQSLVPASQVGSALEALPDVAIAVTDRYGNPVAGVAVAFAVVDGDGTLSAPQSSSDALGNARVRWTLGPRTGAQHIRASLAGAHPAEVIVTATARQQLLGTRQAASIILVNVDNGSEKVLGAPWYFVGNPTWSPDGRRIALVGRTDSTVKKGIYVMNADGTGVTLVTRTDSTEDGEVDWSPDGTRLVFTRLGATGTRIFLVAPNGTGLAQLTNTQSGSPRWSPDGSRIAFSQRSSSNQFMEIAIMHADGSNVQYLTANQTDDEAPSWSPDGAQIVYAGWRTGRSRLYLIGADGTGDILLPTTVPVNHSYDAEPAWSRDGSLIAFARGMMSADALTFSSGIYTVHPDGSGVTALVTGTGTVGSPRWRP